MPPAHRSHPHEEEAERPVAQVRDEVIQEEIQRESQTHSAPQAAPQQDQRLLPGDAVACAPQEGQRHQDDDGPHYLRSPRICGLGLGTVPLIV